MKKLIFPSISLFISLCLGLMVSFSAIAGNLPAVGEVTFVLGQAERVVGDKKELVKKGSLVHVGDQYVTGADGHIHIHFVDDAFVSVRTNSKLTIDQYRYDSHQASASQVKFSLHQGVARSISGKAGQAAKDNYRLNTPTAAIGIRGTDFVVQANAEVTRVTVQSGAIVLAPLGDSCSAQASGPCNTLTSRVLTAAMRNTYLELRGRETAPILVAPDRALDAPNKISPPRPEEPKVVGDKAALTSSSSTNLADAPIADIRAQQTSSTLVKINDIEVWWGRWGNLAGLPSDRQFLSYLNSNVEIGTGNWLYGLLRTPMTNTLPNSGQASFSLLDSEAYLVGAQNQVSPLKVQDASLTMNFESRTFNTHLTLTSTSSAPVTTIDSSGAISFQGIFLNSPNTTGTEVSGVLSNSLNQAGYVFSRGLNNGNQAVGVTRWQR